MKLRRVLSSIVWLLICAILGAVIYKYNDKISKTIVETVNTVKKEKVIIPEEKYNSRTYEFETVKLTDNFEPHSLQDIKNIYYTVLNNGWEEFTFYCPSKYETCIDDVLQIANKSTYLEIINYYVSPYNIYSFYNTTVSTTGEVYLTIDKVYTNDEINYLKDYVDQTLVDLGINTSKPTKQDLRKIHDHLIKNITYDDNYIEGDLDSDSNNAIGAIKNHKAVCSGYTDAYALFLDRLNIKNFKLPSERHIWNYVYYDNSWTHTDLTWDDDEVNKNNTGNFFMIDTKKLNELDNKKHIYKKELFLEVTE